MSNTKIKISPNGLRQRSLLIIWKGRDGIYTPCEKCSYSAFSWSAFSRIRIGYGDLHVRIQSECGKMCSRKKANVNTFNAVIYLMKTLKNFLLKVTKSYEKHFQIHLLILLNCKEHYSKS